MYPQGEIAPYSSVKLIVRYYPGVPARFNKLFKIQVAHFEPDVIQVVGEGVFPRIKLDLPRFGDQEGVYASFLAEAHGFLCEVEEQRSMIGSHRSSKDTSTVQVR